MKISFSYFNRVIKRYFSFRRKYLKLLKRFMKMEHQLSVVIKDNSKLRSENLKLSEEIKSCKLKVRGLMFVIKKNRQRQLKEEERRSRRN